VFAANQVELVWAGKSYRWGRLSTVNLPVQLLLILQTLLTFLVKQATLSGVYIMAKITVG